MTNIKLNDIDRQIRKENKIKWIMNGRWGKLTTGEKVARVTLKLLRFAVIAAVIALVVSVVIGVALGIMVAMGVASAISGGFENVSRSNTNRLYGMYRW